MERDDRKNEMSMYEIRIVCWNVHGLKDKDRMNDAVEMMKKNIGIVVFVETHFDNYDCSEFWKLARKNGYKCFSVMRLMKKGDHGSGGVTIMVDERLKCRLMRKSKLEDLLWVSVEFEHWRWCLPRARRLPEPVRQMSKWQKSGGRGSFRLRRAGHSRG